MATVTVSETLKTLAKDLNKDYPRSPRETLGGYVIAGRTLDKCRAVLNGSQGEYHFNCPLDRLFLDFSGIDADEFKAYVATGASDEEVGEWIKSHAKQQERIEVVRWNNQQRYSTIKELKDQLQLFMEDYIAEVVPAGKVVYHWFDVYDIEEKRI
ncbi:MAG: hypothetical protein K0Q50_1825 [Vampirovibrio sp.]|nr:hypothetical protein [Vampirovibrio sp.]